ncbi:MAG: GH25 family lysozyme [bacterium]|nr:GH25 family lysozyme [bacterium]
MTNRAQGIDISHWDVSFDPQKATKQIDFVIIKASDGLYSSQPVYSKMMAGVRQIPIRGAYHYLRSGYDWKRQADVFLEKVEKDKKDFHLYVCDFESINNTMSIAFSMHANLWMEYVQKEVPTKRVVFYTNRNLYTLWGWRYCSKWPLWIAQYYNWPFGTENRNPAMPSGRTDWSIYQFQCERNQFPGQSRSYGCGARFIDLDVYNGTVADMRAWLRLDEATTPPVVPPVDKPKVAQVMVSSLRVRAGPGTNFDVVHGLAFGARVKVYEVKNIAGDQWAKLGEGNWIAMLYKGLRLAEFV